MDSRFAGNCEFRRWIARAERDSSSLRPSPWALEALEVLSQLVEEGRVKRGPPSPTGEPTFEMTSDSEAAFKEKWRETFWGSD